MLNKAVILSLIVCLFTASIVYGDECGIKEFKKNADGLDQSKIESVDSLKELFRQQTAARPQGCISPLFTEFRSYYYDFMNAYEKSIEDYLGNYPLPQREEAKLESKLKKAGWHLDESEGMYYIGENGEWFLQEFGSVLPGDWKRYLQQRKKEIKEKFSEDARLLISWENVRGRIMFWENFLKKYPAFSQKDTVDYYLVRYIRTYLTGMSNSSIADFETDQVQDEVLRTYRNFLTSHKESKYYSLVEGQFDILRRNDFQLTEKTGRELEAFYRKNGIKSMAGVQPPNLLIFETGCFPWKRT